MPEGTEVTADGPAVARSLVRVVVGANVHVSGSVRDVYVSVPVGWIVGPIVVGLVVSTVVDGSVGPLDCSG